MAGLRAALTQVGPTKELFRKSCVKNGHALCRKLGGQWLDRDDHVVQTSGIVVHDLTLRLAYDYCVGVTKASPVGIVDAWLATEGHAHFQYCLVAFSDPGRLVTFESDTVACAVLQELRVTGVADLVEAHFVDFFGNHSLFQVDR